MEATLPYSDDDEAVQTPTSRFLAVFSCLRALRVDRPEARRTEDGGGVVWYGRNWRAAEDVRPYQATALLRRRAAEDVRPYQKKTLLCVLW